MMDFIEGLPKSKGYDSILVIVRLSNYAHFSLLKHPFIAQTMVAGFVCDIVKLHGIPCSIIPIMTKYFLVDFGWTYSDCKVPPLS